MRALWREFPSLKQETSALNPTPRRVAEPSRAVRTSNWKHTAKRAEKRAQNSAPQFLMRP